MFRKPLIIVIVTTALVIMACGVNINLPLKDIKTGPTETEQINIAKPDISGTVDLTLAFGAGELTVNPGAKEGLVTGEATYNVPDFKPVITSSGSQVKIEEGNLNVNGIPDFQDKVKNTWDLQLSDTPLNLKINAGAYVGKYDLGGLSIKNLEISDGASDANLTFSTPNQSSMDVFRYTTGASNVSLNNLANANFSTMIFRSGAGSYHLDFSGELKQDMAVSVDSGISTLVITIPEGVAAQVSFSGNLTNVDISGAWTKNGDVYSQTGSGSKITIIVKMGAGNLELRNK